MHKPAPTTGRHVFERRTRAEVRRSIHRGVAATLVSAALLSATVPALATGQAIPPEPPLVGVAGQPQQAPEPLRDPPSPDDERPVPEDEREVSAAETERVSERVERSGDGDRDSGAGNEMRRAKEREGGPRPGSRYAVRVGDHLWKIATQVVNAGGDGHADRAKIASYWADLVRTALPEISSGDPNLIHPGEQIMLPPLPGSA